MPSALRPALKALRSKVRALTVEMLVASDSELITCQYERSINVNVQNSGGCQSGNLVSPLGNLS